MIRLPYPRLMFALALVAGVALLATEAQASEGSVCRGATPEIGQTLRGPILHVEDGQHLCVALSDNPNQWVEVQVLDAPLQKASTKANPRGVLMAAAFAQNAVCDVTQVIDGRAVAACAIDGQPLAQRLSQPSIVKTGQSWR